MRTTPVLVKLDFPLEAIYATPEHPFFDLHNQQVLAGNLKAGDTLKTYDGYAIVQNTRSIDTTATVYNFHVSNFHTYYVGKSKLWVHNMMSHQLFQGALKTKVDDLISKKLISNDEVTQLAGDMSSSKKFSGMMNGKPDFIEPWLVLKRTGADQKVRLANTVSISNYMKNNRQSLTELVAEITKVKGYYRWSGINLIKKEWNNFIEKNNIIFFDRLTKFRGNYSIRTPDFLNGGEGRVWLSEKYPGKALKRWFKNVIGKFESSVERMNAMAKYIDNHPNLSKDLDIVRIHKKEADWILRDFEVRSIPLKQAMIPNDADAATAALARAKIVLKQSKNPLVKEVYGKLERLSANLHWSRDRKKIIIIDIDGVE